MRLIKDRYRFRGRRVARADVRLLGALFASVLFPLVLVPKLGLIRSALFFGVVNAGGRAVEHAALRRADCQAAASAGRVRRGDRACCRSRWPSGSRINAFAEDNIYADEIILSRDTPYQHIVLTRWKDDLRLFLNSHLQFSSRDEYRYHEALVHPGLASVAGAAPRAGARRRRRPRRARDSEVSRRSSASCSSISIPR